MTILILFAFVLGAICGAYGLARLDQSLAFRCASYKQEIERLHSKTDRARETLVAICKECDESIERAKLLIEKEQQLINIIDIFNKGLNVKQ